ncbi:MAG: hypothetical protein K6T86_08315 [Pirellulales bacterium]|nr:hypothetical protein [Pirellulales bacterium]
MFRLCALILVLLLVLPAVAEGCPSCKAALASQEGGQGNLVQGFFWSILFLLSMPVLIVGGLSTYMYTLVRKARKAASGKARQLGQLTPAG